MNSTTTRTPIDVAPQHRDKATLPFVLALLSIPGVTLAWDLPAGGFWIGIPLALAAVILGVRARPRPLALPAIIIGAIAIGFTATWTVVSALG